MVAVVALATPVLADDNVLNFVQDGLTNEGSVEQTGLSNQAGTTDHPVHQTGVDDSLTLIQSGNNNNFGLSGDGAVQFGTASTDGAASNSADIVQNSNGNSIGELVQQSGATHATTANVISITQDIGDDNTIASARQIAASGASANTATIVQTGEHNWLDALAQQASSADGVNRVLFKATGNYNGASQSATAGPGVLAIVARSTGAAASRIVQGADLSGGANNDASLIITGDYNEFGIEQLGIDNTATTTMTGLGNSLASYQQGQHNQVSSGDIAGDGNDMGLRQTGTDNAIAASLQWSSSYNEVGIGQDGDTNTADVTLKGDHNVFGVSQLGRGAKATVTSTGDGNVLIAIAANDGAARDVGNTLDVSINGDGNNGSATAFTGAALQLADQAPAIPASLLLAPDASLMLDAYRDRSLPPGLLVQWGDGNTMTIAVGAARVSNSNAFAVVQLGAANTLTASIDGDDNELVVLQLGSGNTASSTIDGVGNITTISQ